MLCDDQRQCDVCTRVIPRGAAYRFGSTTLESLKARFSDLPELLPSLTEEGDGLVRLDICAPCAAFSKRITACTEIAVDLLH